jgi:hypothetical protein
MQQMPLRIDDSTAETPTLCHKEARQIHLLLLLLLLLLFAFIRGASQNR